MAPEVIYPEKFGFTGEYRKRLPSRSTDIYALGMTILEVSTFLSLLRVEISYNSLGRSLRDVLHSTRSPQSQLLCTESSKGTDQVGRLQGFRIDCGGYW